MRHFKAVLQFLAAVVLTLAAIEVYLQTAEIQTPMETQIDPAIGPTFLPNKRVTRFNEGFYIGGTNKYGYLGPARPPREKAGEYRILLLGDSFVMGTTLFPRHHFGARLERELSAETGFKVETLNFGKADFNLSNMYQYYEDFASRFDHDLALFFAEQNDIVPARQIETDLYPHLYVENDSLRVDYGFNRSEKYRVYQRIEPISEHSALFRLVYNARKMVARGQLGRVILDKFAFLLKKPGPAPTSAPDASPTGKHVPDWTLPVLKTLARDPRNVLVLMDKLDPPIRKLVDESGIAVIDLTPVFDKLEAEGFDPYYWPITHERGHWNQRTHAAIANYLAEKLRGRIGKR